MAMLAGMETERLVHRLNRIQGQINAIREKVADPDPEQCERVMVELKTVTRALKKFGEAYIAAHIGDCIAGAKSPREVQRMQERLLTAIHSAFDM